MRDDLIKDWFGDGEDPARYDPVRSARAALTRNLPKRFYEKAALLAEEGGFTLTLDGRPARTKLRHPLRAEEEAVGQLLVAEWAAQGEHIDPATMPVTRILHAAIDSVSQTMAEVRADIVKYAGSDLVCYRAAEPDKLVARQAEVWDPVLAHFASRHGARFLLSEGITFVTQPEQSLAKVAALVEDVVSAQRLAALHVLTSLSGSALVALALLEGALTAQTAFVAGELDADFERDIWGSDDEAEERRAARWQDFAAAAAVLGRGGA